MPPPASERGELSHLAVCRIFRLRMVLGFMASVEGPSLHSSGLRIVFQITGAIHAAGAAEAFSWRQGSCYGKFTTLQFSAVSPANPEDGELRQVHDRLVQSV